MNAPSQSKPERIARISRDLERKRVNEKIKHALASERRRILQEEGLKPLYFQFTKTEVDLLWKERPYLGRLWAMASLSTDFASGKQRSKRIAKIDSEAPLGNRAWIALAKRGLAVRDSNGWQLKPIGKDETTLKCDRLTLERLCLGKISAKQFSARFKVELEHGWKNADYDEAEKFYRSEIQANKLRAKGGRKRSPRLKGSRVSESKFISNEVAKPWEKEGISRITWYRRRSKKAQ